MWAPTLIQLNLLGTRACVLEATAHVTLQWPVPCLYPSYYFLGLPTTSNKLNMQLRTFLPLQPRQPHELTRPNYCL